MGESPFAKRTSYRGQTVTQLPATEDASIRGIMTGQTVIVLENGDVICGRLTPKSVRVNPTRDADGSLNYDVEWNIEMGKVGKKA